MNSLASKKKDHLVVKETFHGYIETTRDSLLLFEACKRGLIPRIPRRLQDKERHLIRSGSIFCFDEKESGIKRWTDGLVWSPSRILGNFLIYRELDNKKLARTSSTDYGIMHGGPATMDENNNNGMMRSRSSSLSSCCSTATTTTASGYMVAPDLLRRQREKALLGSLKTSYKFKRNGLIKKSMSLIVDGVQQHIISYYNKEDVLSSRLKTPSRIVELSSLEVSPGLRLRQNFRIPIFLSDEASDDRFMEDYQSNNNKSDKNSLNGKTKYSDFIKPLDYEMNSSPSSFASSTTGSSSSSDNNSNNLLAPLYSQQHAQFYPVTKVPNGLCSPVTHSYTSYSASESSMNDGKLSSIPESSPLADYNVSDRQQMLINNNHLMTHDSIYHTSNISKSDSMLVNKQLTESEYNNSRATQTNEQEAQEQAAIMTNLMKKSFISMQNQPKEHISDIIHINNISADKKFGNTNNITSAKSFSNHNKREIPATINISSYSSGMPMNFPAAAATENNLIPRGGYNPFAYYDDYHQGQNPHQHLFSSSSFHAINHAAIPNRVEIATNAFMLDMNMLLGTGWNEFELQM